jgi:putative DNA primase/helicase
MNARTMNGADEVRARIAQAKLVPVERRSDVGNARRLVRTHGRDIHFVPGKGWIVWDDNHWLVDTSGGAIMRKAKDAVEQIHAEARLINDEDQRRMTRQHAMNSESVGRIKAMIELAASEPGVELTANLIDADPMLFGVSNGVVDLRTGEFREARRDDYVTKIGGIAFDAGARCPNWTAFLKRVLDDDVSAYLKRAVGYALTGRTSEEVLFVLWGSGNNGKSTFRETIFALFGDYAMGADATLLMTSRGNDSATPDLARLQGRRFVTVNETGKSDVLNEAKVKFITGHDVITARHLYQSPFDFTPTHKSFLTTNNKPIIKGTDEGIWRRINLVPFVKAIESEQKDVNFREKMLLPELAGIFNWALEGCEEYLRGGLMPPDSVTKATQKYRDDMDLVGQWIEENCERGPAMEETSANLYREYETWAKREVSFAISNIAFGRELSGRGFENKKVRRMKGFGGLRLKSSVIQGNGTTSKRGETAIVPDVTDGTEDVPF